MAPYFSIILPIYNVEAYLERCAQSILSQKFQDFELILVDDGATDRSPQICDALAAHSKNIRVLHKENGGLSSARNAGAEIARGQYVWWVDSDDWIEPGALKLLYEQSCETLPDIVKFDHIRVEQKSSAVFHSNVPPGLYERGTALKALIDTAFYRAGEFGLSAWTNIYKREFLEENNLTFVSERQIGSEDYLFNLQALTAVKKICVLDTPLYNYELRVGSLTQKYKHDLFQRYTWLYACLREYFAARGSLKHYEKKICGFYVWHLLHGTWMFHEYQHYEGHTPQEGRANVRAHLKDKSLRKAVKNCDMRAFSLKQRLQLQAMKLGFEPLFYRLYVLKPNKERQRNDNSL